MKMIEKIKSMNTYELADWLDEYIEVYSAPWTKWFDKNFCKKCYAEIIHNAYTDRDMEYSWCKLNDKCKFFKELDDIPSDKQIIRMWLNSEVNDGV